jgi:hypothetical protein
MRKLKLVILGVAALVGLALAPTAAHAACTLGSCWGAVAFGPNNAWAYAVNYPSRASAGTQARAKCGGVCTNVLTFKNSCGAYATGPTAMAGATRGRPLAPRPSQGNNAVCGARTASSALGAARPDNVRRLR